MITNDQVVSIHYHLTDSEGEVIDSSRGKDPLSYLHGHGAIVPGLENALTGREVGDKFEVVVPPEEGYGVRDESKIGKISREQVDSPELKPGVRLQAQTPNGPLLLTVVEVGESEVTVDANHQLAGMALHFDIEVVGSRDAEQVELDHGHAHT